MVNIPKNYIVNCELRIGENVGKKKKGKNNWMDKIARATESYGNKHLMAIQQFILHLYSFKVAR